MAMRRVTAAEIIHAVVVLAGGRADDRSEDCRPSFSPMAPPTGGFERDEAEIDADGHRPGFPGGGAGHEFSSSDFKVRVTDARYQRIGEGRLSAYPPIAAQPVAAHTAASGLGRVKTKTDLATSRSVSRRDLL